MTILGHFVFIHTVFNSYCVHCSFRNTVYNKQCQDSSLCLPCYWDFSIVAWLKHIRHIRNKRRHFAETILPRTGSLRQGLRPISSAMQGSRQSIWFRELLWFPGGLSASTSMFWCYVDIWGYSVVDYSVIQDHHPFQDGLPEFKTWFSVLPLLRNIVRGCNPDPYLSLLIAVINGKLMRFDLVDDCPTAEVTSYILVPQIHLPVTSIVLILLAGKHLHGLSLWRRFGFIFQSLWHKEK